jgi:dihydroorotate dehydrogenase (NAD+) catalytic subunit
MDNQLIVYFLGLELKNPFVLASGILGTSEGLLERIAEMGIGAVTSKSCSLEPREGHANPIALDWGHGIINAVGLTNPGAKKEANMLKETKKRIHPFGTALFASIFGRSAEEFAETARIIADAEPDLIELNISCPNVHDEFGTPFSANEKSAAQVTRAVKKAVSIPISVKLAPNVPNLARIALAVTGEGADAFTAINTMPGMIIDARARRPILTNKSGGLSGAAIKPIALRCVAEIALQSKTPIIGTGGISSGMDAAEMLMAGASLVGIGSVIWSRGIMAIQRLIEELNTFMIEEKISSLGEIIGVALK